MPATSSRLLLYLASPLFCDGRVLSSNPAPGGATARGACFHDSSRIVFEDVVPGTALLQERRGCTLEGRLRAEQLGQVLELPLTPLLIPGVPVRGADDQQVLHKSGPAAGRPVVFGQALSESGKDLVESSWLNSRNPDFFSLFLREGRLFSVQHFEGAGVASMYVVEYNAEKQRQDGRLEVFDAQAVRLRDVMGDVGGHLHCSGSVTPWSSHLASEEYAAPGDWFSIDSGGEQAQWQTEFFDNGTVGNVYRPYRYGFPVEVTVLAEAAGPRSRIGADGYFSARRHYSMGRVSHETPLCLPDMVTCYMSDDWPSGIFTMFRAARAGDLSEGELFAARASSPRTLPLNMTADIEWISLGSASNHELEQHLGVAFEELIEKTEPVEGSPCPSGFGSTNSLPSFGGRECIRVRPGMEIPASRFEPRRVAALQGATHEFSRMEGVTYDAKRNYLYASMTTVGHSILDNSMAYDDGGPNDLRWPPNLCGCVVAIALDRAMRATALWPLICGEERARKLKDGDQESYCAHDSVAGPDNLAYAPDADGLLIAEDTAAHARNVLWLLDLAALDMAPGVANPQHTKQHLRALYLAPEGAEVSSPGYYPSLNGFAYLTLAASHPDGCTAFPAVLGPLPKCCNSSSVFNAPGNCPAIERLSMLFGHRLQDIDSQTATLRRAQQQLDQDGTLLTSWMGRRSKPHPEDYLTCGAGKRPGEDEVACMRRQIA